MACTHDAVDTGAAAIESGSAYSVLYNSAVAFEGSREALFLREPRINFLLHTSLLHRPGFLCRLFKRSLQLSSDTIYTPKI